MKWHAHTAAWALTLGLIGCGSDGTNAPEDADTPYLGETTIELFSWWTQPGEAEALQALIQLHRDTYPGERIYNAAEVASAGGVDAKVELATRLEEGNPPDVFQQNAFEVLTALGQGSQQFQPLDDLFEAEGLRDKIVGEVLANVTYEGHAYALPVNIHRENALFYNVHLFKQHAITPPTTIDELLAVCVKLKAAGVTPFAVSPQSWILGKMFEGIAQGTMSPEVFVAYYTRQGSIDEPALKRAIEMYATFVTEYSNVATIDDSFGWTQAADAVMDGDAAMFLHGDWVKGYLMQAGATPDVDFDVVGAPGAQDLFVYGVDVFVVPVGAPHRDAAFDFLRTVASPTGQAAFNTLKGSTPMRFDVPLDKLDPVAKEVLEDFKNAKMRVALHGSPALSDALGWFTFPNAEHPEYYRDTAMLLQTAIENPPGP